MRTIISLIFATVTSILLVFFAINIIPNSGGEIAPVVTFRYTTSIKELTNMVKVGDVIVDDMQNPIMKVASVSIRSLNSAIVTPTGEVKVVDNPQVWEVTFTARGINKGIIPNFIIGGSVYLESNRWRKLVRVIDIQNQGGNQ